MKWATTGQLALAFGWLVWCLLAGAAAGQDGKFTDVTAESGIGPIIAAHYEQNPKWWLSGLHLIDVDGDGKLDFVTGAHGGGPAIAALNDGKGRFTLAPGYVGTEVHICCDINEDGKLDLQMNHGDGGGKWWINESSPGKVALKDSGITAGQARVNAMLDINGDGKVDWLHERPGVTWELGDGKGRFGKGGSLPSGAIRNETNIHYGDLQGKGLIDLALQWGRYDDPAGRSRLYYRDANGGYADATARAGLSDAAGLVIKGVGDVNQDGAGDLLVLESKQPQVYLNDGAGRFRRLEGAFQGVEAARKPVYVSWGLATVTDLDNDGVADVLWNGRNFLWVFRGLGGGKFQYANRAWGIDDFSAASVDDGLCFGDIDGDGDLDLIGYAAGGGGDKRQVKVYRNDLPRRGWIRVRPVGAAGNVNAAGAKITIAAADGAGRPGRPLWKADGVQIISSQSAHSYYSHAQTERHYGLGTCRKVDVTVQFHPSGRKVESRGVDANSTVVVRE